MKYSKDGEIVEVILDRNAIVYKGVEHPISNLLSKDEKKTKFYFASYMVKIFKDNLSLCDINTSKLIKTFILQDESFSIKSSLNERYIIKKNTFIEIDNSRNFITLEEGQYPVTNSYKSGSSNVYVCEKGELKLGKLNTWNNVSIMKFI